MLLNGGEKPLTRGTSWVWNKKVLRFVVAICLVGGFAFFLWPHVEGQEEAVKDSVSNITITSGVQCKPDFDVLRRLEIQKLSDYVKREVVAVPTTGTLPIRQRLETTLFEHFEGHDHTLTRQSQDDCSVSPPISLQVSKSLGKANASHIDFGVATTLDRLNDSLDAFYHWAGHTHTRIFALIEPDEEKKISEVLVKANALGINLHVTQLDEEYQRRYFSLVSHLSHNVRSETQWACIIDDDTFFPSMTGLVKALGEYDANQPMYVGGVSESLPQVGSFGLMGFGGAGVFLSRPLLQQISKPEVFNECANSPHTGDRRISVCIYQHTLTRLTIHPGLRQLDLTGDLSGFFESQRPPPLSVHHWKSWFHSDMAKIGIVGELCGDSCRLQQFKFADGWILTNGYSVVKYGAKVDPDDISMEITWDAQNGEMYLHALGPLRPKDADKFSYLLADSVLDGNKVRQYYIHHDSKNGDQVLELVWQT
ncbi:hypothetical protein EYZ11_004037 [Aspergillus tanneri]|uniref:Fringe-like glycosyltransferase domain-containing protein n=1 Tax=Aspergillus tanneri TaxID=1220188 RepID=A0A4S3JLY0_9EURO|nr:uncharacterized protein ATNIH1004_004696 [Aspergillus tanneri]KAA8648811.1 hypothetical protein ATNIH1004_004696 [Aspergillus tanneri]THC96493.1 hypothetical protein EYZ11_004037 [Aspergillus tanneri]